MRISKLGLFGLVLGGAALLGADARAVTVSYVTLGTFTGGSTPGTSTYTAPGIQISFTSAGPGPGGSHSVNVPPEAGASFGQFNTALPAPGTTAPSPVPISSGFILDIFEITPTPGGTAQFVGSISGELFSSGGVTILEFNPAQLTRQIGLVTYQIVNATQGVPGRITIAPPSTNNGVTAIEGRINFIPEPSAMVLVGMGALGPVALMLRRRVRKSSPA